MPPDALHVGYTSTASSGHYIPRVPDIDCIFRKTKVEVARTKLG